MTGMSTESHALYTLVKCITNPINIVRCKYLSCRKKPLFLKLVTRDRFHVKKFTHGLSARRNFVGEPKGSYR